MTDDDINFLTASAMNIYLESMRRDGRVLLTPQDIPILHGIIDTICRPVKPWPVKDVARSRDLTSDEQTQLLTTFAKEVTP